MDCSFHPAPTCCPCSFLCVRSCPLPFSYLLPVLQLLCAGCNGFPRVIGSVTVADRPDGFHLGGASGFQSNCCKSPG